MANNFNELYNVELLQKSLNEVENKSKKSGDFPEVPVGKYEVKIEKIELAATKDGTKPMGKIQFRIIEGEFKKSCLFMNQVLIGTDKKTGELSVLGLHNFNEFLKTLDSGKEIKFKDFYQYEQLLLDVAEAVESLIYEIQYGKNNDYPTYKVLNIYED